MRIAPRDRVTETTIGRSSGVSPTASATANRNDSSQGRPAPRVHQQHEQHHEQREPQDQESECPRALLERRRWRLALEGSADLGPGQVLAPGLDDDGTGRAAHDRRPHQDGFILLGELKLLAAFGAGGPVGVLLQGKGLARQQRLIDEQVARLEAGAHRRARDRRPRGARRRPETTSVRGISLGLAVPQDGRADVGGLSKPFRGASGAMFLHEIQDDTEKHHHQDHDEAARVPRTAFGDRRGARRSKTSGLRNLSSSFRDRTPVSVGNDVPAVHRQPFGRPSSRDSLRPWSGGGRQSVVGCSHGESGSGTTVCIGAGLERLCAIASGMHPPGSERRHHQQQTQPALRRVGDLDAAE